MLRVYEAEGKRVKDTLKLFGKEYELDIGAYAIETVDEDGRKLNFVEWEI